MSYEEAVSYPSLQKDCGEFRRDPPGSSLRGGRSTEVGHCVASENPLPYSTELQQLTEGKRRPTLGSRLP